MAAPIHSSPSHIPEASVLCPPKTVQVSIPQPDGTSITKTYLMTVYTADGSGNPIPKEAEKVHAKATELFTEYANELARKSPSSFTEREVTIGPPDQRLSEEKISETAARSLEQLLPHDHAQPNTMGALWEKACTPSLEDTTYTRLRFTHVPNPPDGPRHLTSEKLEDISSAMHKDPECKDFILHLARILRENKSLSPEQRRNLETALSVKALDVDAVIEYAETRPPEILPNGSLETIQKEFEDLAALLIAMPNAEDRIPKAPSHTPVPPCGIDLPEPPEGINPSESTRTAWNDKRLASGVKVVCHVLRSLVHPSNKQHAKEWRTILSHEDTAGVPEGLKALHRNIQALRKAYDIPEGEFQRLLLLQWEKTTGATSAESEKAYTAGTGAVMIARLVRDKVLHPGAFEGGMAEINKILNGQSDE